RMRGRQGGEHRDIWFRATMGLRKTGGRWLIVHDHSSVPFYMDGSYLPRGDGSPAVRHRREGVDAVRSRAPGAGDGLDVRDEPMCPACLTTVALTIASASEDERRDAASGARSPSRRRSQMRYPGGPMDVSRVAAPMAIETVCGTAPGGTWSYS